MNLKKIVTIPAKENNPGEPKTQKGGYDAVLPFCTKKQS